MAASILSRVEAMPLWQAALSTNLDDDVIFARDYWKRRWHARAADQSRTARWRAATSCFSCARRIAAAGAMHSRCAAWLVAKCVANSSNHRAAWRAWHFDGE